MLRLFLLSLIFWTLSCNPNSGKGGITGKNKKFDSLSQKIKLDFSAKYLAKGASLGVGSLEIYFDSLDKVKLDSLVKVGVDNLIEVNASLFNNNLDTAYFLQSTCDGTQFLLKYDTSKFSLHPITYCNASYVTIEKIAPNTQFNFKGYLISKIKQKEISLCIDFIRVDKSFDVGKTKLQDIYRRRSEQNLICSDKKVIQE